MDTISTRSLSPLLQSATSDCSDIIPVILSGGDGARLWPVSRESFPKQFCNLIKDDRSMIVDTAGRAMGQGFAPPVVVCNDEHRFIVAEQLREGGIAHPRIVLEPVGRNSAPAVAAAALLIAQSDPHAVMWVMAADQAFADTPALHAVLAQAVTGARAGRIVMLGIQPTGPEANCGYIEAGADIEGLPGLYSVAGFTANPGPAAAATLTASGALWNSGMFVFTAATVLAELRLYEPAIIHAAERALADASWDLDFIKLDSAFASSPSTSLDCAIAGVSLQLALVSAELRWADVRSWNKVWDQGAKDADGNVAIGDIMLEGANGCYVRSDGIMTAVVGLTDAVIVVTDDAVLAMHKDCAQDVRVVVDRMKAARRAEAVTHKRMYRPWGFYESLISGKRFQVKRIVVNPGQRLSLQMHHHRAEHWVVVNGTALVTRESDEILLRENESIYLPLGVLHRLENPGRILLTLIEVQSGSYLGEDDIVRSGDTYGRV